MLNTDKEKNAKEKMLSGNQSLILNAYQSLLENNKRITISELQRTSGIKQRELIESTLASLSMDVIADKYKPHADNVLLVLLDKCQKGCVKSIKLYFQLVWGWQERTGDDDESKDILPPVINISSADDSFNIQGLN